MTPQQLRDAEAWITNYTTASERTDAALVATVWAAYAAVDDWTNPDQTLPAAALAATAAQSGVRTNTGLIREFVAGMLYIATGRRPRTGRAALDYPRSVPPFDVYSRPVFDARAALEQGLSEEMARLQAEHRAEVISLTDALLARRAVAAAEMEYAGVQRYRRLVHPELSTTGTCGLCIAAAARIYRIRDLMPIHSRCRCTVAAIVAGFEPGELNTSRIEHLYAETPGTNRSELAKTRYRVIDDPELGPVLTPAAA